MTYSDLANNDPMRTQLLLEMHFEMSSERLFI